MLYVKRSNKIWFPLRTTTYMGRATLVSIISMYCTVQLGVGFGTIIWRRICNFSEAIKKTRGFWNYLLDKHLILNSLWSMWFVFPPTCVCQRALYHTNGPKWLLWLKSKKVSFNERLKRTHLGCSLYINIFHRASRTCLCMKYQYSFPKIWRANWSVECEGASKTAKAGPCKIRPEKIWLVIESMPALNGNWLIVPKSKLIWSPWDSKPWDSKGHLRCKHLDCQAQKWCQALLPVVRRTLKIFKFQ